MIIDINKILHKNVKYALNKKGQIIASAIDEYPLLILFKQDMTMLLQRPSRNEGGRNIPSLYFIVEQMPFDMTQFIVKQCVKPGVNWRKIRKEMISQCKEMCKKTVK